MYGGEITANVLSAEGSAGGGIWSAGTVVIGGNAQILRNSALRGDGGSGGVCGDQRGGGPGLQRGL